MALDEKATLDLLPILPAAARVGKGENYTHPIVTTNQGLSPTEADHQQSPAHGPSYPLP
jgi:hypothetical protein